MRGRTKLLLNFEFAALFVDGQVEASSKEPEMFGPKDGDAGRT